jgi:hypothetical protein
VGQGWEVLERRPRAMRAAWLRAVKGGLPKVEAWLRGALRRVRAVPREEAVQLPAQAAT